ncbi:MAG: hypothetical protein QXG97_07160 [Nitrososphaerota archaeon]
MFSFLRRRKSSIVSSQKGTIVDASQKQLDYALQKTVQDKYSAPSWASSIRQIENEVNDEIKAFQSRVKEMKETSMRLDELAKMLKSGDISENVYRLIMSELGSQLSTSVEEIFRLREMLEVAKAKAKLEWAKEKIGMRETETQQPQEPTRNIYVRRDVYSPLSRWEEIANRIDAALSSLTVEEEASIIEQYLSLVKERLSVNAGSEQIERGVELCRERMKPLSEKWASLRRSKIESIMNLELEASRLRDDLKELEVRFSVGELDQIGYEYRMSDLQASLKKVEKEIAETRKFVDDMDMKIFRCSELLRENP